MKPMTPLERQCAENVAVILADLMCTQIPSLFGDPPEALIGITLPLACELVRAKAKAVRNGGDAKRYRKLMREARELLRAEPDAPVRPGGLGQTVPFDPDAWHCALVPGLGRDRIGVQRAAS